MPISFPVHLVGKRTLGQAVHRFPHKPGDGKRVRLEDRFGATVFIYDGSEVLAEMDATGVLQVAYTRTSSGRLISQWQKGETYWYHQDALGSAAPETAGLSLYGAAAGATATVMLTNDVQNVWVDFMDYIFD